MLLETTLIEGDGRSETGKKKSNSNAFTTKTSAGPRGLLGLEEHIIIVLSQG